VLWHDKDIALRALPAEQRTDWQAKIDAARKPDEKGRVVGMPGRWQTLLSDGKSIWAHHSFGVTVCLDAAGKQKWAVVTGLSDPAMLVVGDKVLLESGGPRGRGAGGQPGRRLALDAATGQTLWQKDIPGGGGLHRLRLTGHASAPYMVASTAGQVFDCRDGRVVLGRFDIDPVPPPSQAKGMYSTTEGFAWHFVDNDLYCAKLSTIHAVRFVMDAAGQVGCRVLWRNNYGIKYDSAIPVCAWGPWTLAVNMVQENCPGHSPAWRREVYVYDRLTGKPVVRLKPVLDNSQNWGASPATLPGRRLFVYDTGALIDNGQIAVVDVGAAQPHLLCRNFIPKGAAPPAFDGQRMFLRKGANIWCLAAATPEGKRYQQQRIAAQVIADILAVPPGAAALAAPEPLRELPKFDKAPRVPLTDGQGIAHWLVAAPLPPPKADQQAATDQKLASLRPALGEKLDLGGAGATFAPLPQDAVDLGYSWGHAYYLDGLGGTTAYPYCKIDLLRCTGGDPNRCGILYTLVDNPRDCQAVVDIPRHGIDVWVGGLKVRTGQALRLKQGVYPVLVRVRPECFERPLPPLDVQAALTEKTALPLSWPKQWMVAAAVPGSVGLLPPDKLASIPDKLDIGGQTYKLAARDADAQGNLELKDLGAVRDGKFASEQTAYCFAPLEADRDGTLVVNCSGDWWMLWYLDGNLVYSTLANGNGTNPKKLAAHSWSAALTKGKHVLTAVVRSGSQGWSVMSLGAIIDKPIDELRKEQIDPKAPLPPTKAAPVTFDLRDAPAAVLAARLRSARIRRAELDKIVASLPGTLEAAAAARWLKLLGGAKGN